MSTRTNQYFVVGAMVQYNENDEQYEKYEPYIDNGYDKDKKHLNGLKVIFDGRDGKYILIGRVLHRSDLDQTLDGPFRIPVIDSDMQEILAGLINATFPWHSIMPADINNWFVTHYH